MGTTGTSAPRRETNMSVMWSTFLSDFPADCVIDRIAATPRHSFLLAPRWCHDKAAVRSSRSTPNSIAEGTRQGEPLDEPQPMLISLDRKGDNAERGLAWTGWPPASAHDGLACQPGALAGGKSGLRRTRWWVTPTGRKARESATESRPPRRLLAGEVRVKR